MRTFVLPKIRTISDLARDAKRIVEEVRETGKPVVVTQRGREAVVIMRAEDYRHWSEELAHVGDIEFHRMLAEAEAEIASGAKLIPLDEAERVLEAEWAARGE